MQRGGSAHKFIKVNLSFTLEINITQNFVGLLKGSFELFANSIGGEKFSFIITQVLEFVF
jgi:hypothetical protein